MTSKHVSPLIVLAAAASLPAQELLEETIVTAARSESELAETPYTASLIDSAFLREESIRSVPDALRESPGVLIQKTAYGHGSPFIRGFTGRQNLLLVDGVRMNNSTWRSGPIQYWNTFDSQSLARLEVIKSQGSVLYGSDAIGGTVNLITKDTGFRDAEAGFYQNGSLHYRFDTNSDSHLGHLRQSIGSGGKWGLSFGLSGKDFGDIKDDGVGRMTNTGYQEEGLDLKVQAALSESATLTFAHSYLNQDGINRWHTTADNPGWIHGSHVAAPGSDLNRLYDQERSLSYLRLDDVDSPLAWINNWSATLSFQRSWDSEDRTRSSGQRDQKHIDTDTYGFTFQAESDLAGGNLLWGTDYYQDEINSEGYRDGAPRPSNRPVADDSQYQSLGIFGSWEKRLSDDFLLTAGARYTYIKAEWEGYRPDGASVDQPGDNSWDNLSFNLRGLYDLNDCWGVYGGLSQSFRAPNISDLTGSTYALNGLSASGSPNIDPEEYLTAEIGTRYTTDKAYVNLAFFHTWVDEAITSVDDGSGGLQAVNAQDGYVYGVEAEGVWQFRPQWEVRATAAWQDG
ncbi:MAG: TonB-dependent receptor plug domain-containing protein, partial [Verrucomicrobiales bacterium]